VSPLEEELDALAAETGYSGIVRVDGPDGLMLERAYGLADRAHGIPNTAGTRFALASGAKGFTALTVVSLAEQGALSLSDTARGWLGGDLPEIDDTVTLEHLLSHRSGIGDYLDEEELDDVDAYVMPVSVHRLATSDDYLAVLTGRPQKFAPGERFSYSNSGYVVLAVIAERAARVPFHELVRERVCTPAGLPDTAFLRSDELPGEAAIGYVLLDGRWRSNVFHLPVRGSGDGGIYSTAADVSRLWHALAAGRIVSERSVAEMTRPHTERLPEGGQYGLGFWLGRGGGFVELRGADAGVSFRSVYDRRRGIIHTALSNLSKGAWAPSRLLDERLETGDD
jgi:CubicO group peptidase (beta-lactamase class C family)